MAKKVLSRTQAREYDILKQSASEIHSLYTSDAQPTDLEAQLRNSTPEDVYIASKEGKDALDYEEFIPLPPEFLALSTSAKSASRMGLLPELNKAWISIDNALYLWDYTAEQNDEFCLYNGFSSTDCILSVGLSKPKVNVFSSSITYILVVTTVMEIALFSCGSGSGSGSGSHDVVKLSRTPYSLPVNGVLHKAVCNSNTDRIFTVDSNGAANEIHYDTVSLLQWPSFDEIKNTLFTFPQQLNGDAPTKKRKLDCICKLTTLGQWEGPLGFGVANFLNSFLQPRSGSSSQSWHVSGNMNGNETGKRNGNFIVDAALDSDHSVLYTCGPNGILNIFDLRENIISNDGSGSGSQRRNRCQSCNILNLANAWLSNCSKVELNLNTKTATVSKLVLLSAKEYEGIHVLVILNNGTRIYLQTVSSNGVSYSGNNISITPDTVRIIKVRHLLLSNCENLVSVSSACYSHGVYLLGGNVSNIDNDINESCLSLLQYTNNNSSDKSISEIIGKPLSTVNNNTSGSGSGDCKKKPSLRTIPHDICEEVGQVELKTGFFSRNAGTHRRFLCLGRYGLHILGKRRSLENLKIEINDKLLSKDNKYKYKMQTDGTKKQLEKFMETLIMKHGAVELCAMIMEIVIEGGESAGKGNELPLLLMKSKDCSSPYLISSSNEYIFKPSAFISGIRLIFARQISHFWNDKITIPRDKRSFDLLKKRLNYLRKLEQVTEEVFAHAISDAPLTNTEKTKRLQIQTSSGFKGNDMFVKSSLETSTISAMFRLLTRTRQTVNLFCILFECGIISDEDEDEDDTLSCFDINAIENMNWRSVITDETTAKTVTSIFRQGLRNMIVASDEMMHEPVTELATHFCEVAPALFHKGEFEEYKAFAILNYLVHENNSQSQFSEKMFDLVQSNLMYASKYWRDLDHVSNPTLNAISVTVSNSNYNIELGLSSLGLYCNMMAQLGSDEYLQYIVVLCIKTATNFFTNESLCVDSDQDSRNYSYHSGHDLTENQRKLCRQYCYHHLLSVICSSNAPNDTNINIKKCVNLTNRQRMMMLEKCLEMTSDSVFMFMMCESLRGRHTQSLLLDLQCEEYLEVYLYTRDKELLFDWYYHSAEKVINAINISNSSNIDVDVDVDAIGYIASQYENASKLMISMAQSNGTDTDSNILGIEPLVEYFPNNESYACDEYIPIAKRYMYMKKAKEALGYSLRYVNILIDSSVVSKKHMEYLSIESLRLQRDMMIISRMIALAKIQNDAYKISMSSNVYDTNTNMNMNMTTRSYNTSTPDFEDVTSPNVMPFITRSNSDNKYKKNINLVLGFTFISEEMWIQECFSVIIGMGLWDISLRLVSVLDNQNQNQYQYQAADQISLNLNESYIIRLWKNFIYSHVPDCAIPGSTSTSTSFTSLTAMSFLKEQRQDNEMGMGRYNISPELSDCIFERYGEWLPIFKIKLEELCIQLGGGNGNYCDSSSATPLAPLIVELEALVSALDQIRTELDVKNSLQDAPSVRGWVINMLDTVKIRRLRVVRAYVAILKTRAKGFESERVMKLIESFTYVLLIWLQDSIRQLSPSSPPHGGISNRGKILVENSHSQDVNEIEEEQRNLSDLKMAHSTKELDQWVDLLRHHLSDMHGRKNLTPLCRKSFGRIQKDFQRVMSSLEEISSGHFRR
jgi:hypothetical protein